MPIVVDRPSFSVSDFVNWQEDGTLDLRPPFQRRAVWKPTLKSSLIDSLLRGYPIPALFLQDRTDARTFTRKLLVVDGQQRLRTLLAFVRPSCLPDLDERDRFSIMRIHDESRAGMTYQDLSAADQQALANTRLSVFVVAATVADTQLLEIFRRMNTYGARLNGQELRNAKFTGEFKEVAYRLAAELLDTWREWRLFSGQQIAEMRDAEFVSDMLVLTVRGVQAGTSPQFDRAYSDWDESFPWAEESRRRILHLVDVLSEAIMEMTVSRRLATRMWIYSLIDALQELLYGGPLQRTGAVKPRRTSARRLTRALTAVHDAIEAGTLPDAVARATRGAASDRGSRAIRARYLRRRLGQSV
jgi:hypothetical protein